MSTRQLLILVLLVGSGMAAAAEEAATPQAASSASPVSDPEKVRQSANAIGKMRSALKDVLLKLEEARATKDVVKLNCVNEKLTQIKGLLRISEQSDVALQEAVAKKESSSAEHQYTKVSIAVVKVSQLRAEAEQCLGQLAFRTDENQTTEVEEPEDLPKGDPTLVTNLPPPTTQSPATLRAPPASPAM